MEKKYYFISVGIVVIIILGVVWFMRPVQAPQLVEPLIKPPVVTENPDNLPDGYTLDNFTVEKILEVSCQEDSDCETPPEYLMMSRCPMRSKCIDKQCTVICPNLEPTNDTCGITNCHGLDITCGENVAQMCTAMYALGDKCRQYAVCGIVDGQCTFISDPEFTACRTCVQECMNKFANDQIEVFNCESQCQ
jgi:hypothetical protein